MGSNPAYACVFVGFVSPLRVSTPAYVPGVTNAEAKQHNNNTNFSVLSPGKLLALASSS